MCHHEINGCHNRVKTANLEPNIIRITAVTHGELAKPIRLGADLNDGREAYIIIFGFE